MNFKIGSSYLNINDVSAPVVLGGLLASSKNSILVTCDSEADALSLYQHLFFHIPESVYLFPSKTVGGVAGFTNEGSRHRELLLQKLSENKLSESIVVSVKSAIEEETINIRSEKIDSLRLVVDGDVLLNDVVRALSVFGYEKSYTVEHPGDCSTRGDIVDFFPPFLKTPWRLEFEFDKLVSLRTFDQASQRTLHLTESFTLTPIQEKQAQDKQKQPLMSCLSDWVVYQYVDRFRLNYVDGCAAGGPQVDLGVSAVSLNNVALIKKWSIISKYIKENDGLSLFYCGENPGLISSYNQGPAITHINRGLVSSFHSSALNALFLSENDFSSKSIVSRWLPPQKRVSSAGLESVSDIELGDYLVYKPFGVCVYRGLTVVPTSAGEQECLSLEFSDGSKVFVSLDKIDLVHKYLGSEDRPKLSTLGKTLWVNQVKKARKAVSLVVKDLVQLYAKKQNQRSFFYHKPGELYDALVSSFPFEETTDQSTSIQSVLDDLSSGVPMDRFVCGDVGFGKTEVALRAIMIAAASSKQSFFLCPTTVLADQHYITCKERLGGLGVTVELLSRFKTKKGQKEVLSKLAKGLIDVVVGTHRLLSADVCAPNLSLLIVDEEHRFGVKHKEKIRLIKSNLDILSLSATPIPRTLQQSLSGIKDISKILTPPVSRRPISTYVKYFNMDMVFSHIDLELNRGGQVYFLQNDIESIPYFHKKLTEKYPKHVIAYAHGRLDSKTLENTILRFFGGDIDILVSTTIIESGLDVTNANTIIINNAQNFGLSQLYQIRGRVGRGERQAYCLLLVPNASLEKNAYKRLKAIEQHTTLGSGYEISLKDLEIRGAGALFGYKQSGHISKVGFQMYCDLLKEAVQEADDKKKDITKIPVIVFHGDALIPDHFVQKASIRLYYYDRLSVARSLEDIQNIQESIVDRFGKVPLETKNMLDVAKLKISFINSIVSSIHIGEKSVEFSFSSLGSFEDVNGLLSVFYELIGEFGGEIKLLEKRNGLFGIFIPTQNIDMSLALSKKSVPLLLTTPTD